MWRSWLRQTIPVQQILESINKTILINTENLQTVPRKHRIFAEKPARKIYFNIKLYPPVYAEIASNLKSILCETGASTAEQHNKNLRQEVQIIYLNKAFRRKTDLCWYWSKLEPDQDAGVSITTHNRFPIYEKQQCVFTHENKLKC